MSVEKEGNYRACPPALYKNATFAKENKGLSLYRMLHNGRY